MKEKMDHLDVYERQLAHVYAWNDGEERLPRNEKRVNEDLPREGQTMGAWLLVWRGGGGCLRCGRRETGWSGCRRRCG